MKRTSFFRKALSVLLSLSMIIGVFAVIPAVEAGAASTHYAGYNVRVRIEVRNDADGWNSASMTVYGTDGYNGQTEYGEVTSTFSSIQGSIDNGGDVYDNTFDFGTAFPTKVDIYTDFGGGVTWRCWEADVYIYVNGFNVKNQHIVSESSAFSSSNDHNVIYIDRSNYPYPDEISVVYADASDSWLPDTDNFGLIYQQPGDTDCNAMVRVSAYDQYGCMWYGLPSMSNTTNPGSDTIPYYNYKSGSNYKYQYYTLTSNLGSDHQSRYKCSYTTANTVYPTKEYNFDAEFIFLHKVDITVNDVIVSTIKNYAGSFTDIAVEPPTGYTIRSYSLTGSGALAYDDTDGTYQYTFGAADGTIKASLKANTYTIAFNGNGNTGGNVSSKTATYDKNLKLPSNLFSNTGYHFTGWNTKADGSGDSFANLAFVKNLTATNGDTVTLYAQWEQNVYTVNLVYPDGLTENNKTVEIPHGGDVLVDEVIPSDTAGGHYHLTTPASSLTNITSNRTINLAYELVDHNYGAQNITVAPTCTTDGEYEEVCLDCGYVKTTVIPHSHQGLVVHPAVPATCVDTGLTEETYCEACDTVVTAAQVVPANGHDYYEPEWEWADDFSWARVTWNCKHCDYHYTMQTIQPAEIRHTDSGPDRIFTTYFNFAGKQYHGTATYYNLYVEVPYVDENGNDATMYATRLSDNSNLVGNAFFVEGEVNLSDSLSFEEDIKIILCDGASLNIESENDGIKLYNEYPDYVNGSPKYARDLTLYGQTNQTGELNITVESDNDVNGIYCGRYAQYGGKVTIDCDAVDPTGFPGEANAIYSAGYNTHGSKIEIHNGELTAHSENAEALFCYHHDIIIDGGKVIATTGDASDTAVLCYDAAGNIVLGCRDENDSIYADSYMINGAGYYSESTISVANGQTLTDGEFHAYSGTLTSEQIAAISGKTLTLHTAHTYVPVWTWASDFSSAACAFTCQGCGDVEETLNAAVTSEVTTAPTCTLEGLRVYTATVTYNETQYTDTQNEIINPTGNHTYGDPVWTWESDYSAAYASFTCSVCGGVHNENATVTSEVTTPLSCTSDGVTTYTATVTLNNNTYTDTATEVTPISSIMTYHAATQPTSTANGNIEYYTCDDCGKIYTYDSATDTYTESSWAEVAVPYFVINDNGTYVRIIGYNGSDSVITIPDTVPDYYPDETIRGLPITAVNQSAFINNTVITKVTMGNNIEKLGWRAFYGCSRLAEVTIGTGFNSIDYDVFMYCNALRKVTCYSTSSTQIYGTTFQGDTNVTVYAPHSSGFSFYATSYPSIRFVGLDAHTYTASWTWTQAGNGYTATADIGCSKCNFTDNALSAAVTVSEHADGYCGNEGHDTYIATLEYDGNTFTDNKTVSLPAPGAHDYTGVSPVWTWSSDNTSCTASFACAICSTPHEVSATISEERLNLKSVLTASVEFEGQTFTTTKTVNRDAKLFIGGVNVSADNASDIFGDGTASYDEATNTLTLNNATLEVSKFNGSGAFGIRILTQSSSAMTINLIGTNKIVDLVTNEGVPEKYGICAFASTPGYKISGSGTLSVEMNAADSGVTYYGIHVRKALRVDGAVVSVNIPGTSKTTGIDLMYSDTALNVINGGKLTVVTGNNAGTYSVSSNSNVVNLNVDENSVLDVASGNAAFNSIKLSTDTAALGALVNTAETYAGSTEWDGVTDLSGYKHIRIPYILDINEDGAKDTMDIEFIIGVYAGDITDATASQLAKADIDGDGTVDNFDAAELERIFAVNNAARGDVNQDGEENLADYALIRAYISGEAVEGVQTADLMATSYLDSAIYADLIAEYGDGVMVTQQYYCADVNGDKAVDAFDLFCVDKYLSEHA